METARYLRVGRRGDGIGGGRTRTMEDVGSILQVFKNWIVGRLGNEARKDQGVLSGNKYYSNS